jgi:hypothetical protein
MNRLFQKLRTYFSCAQKALNFPYPIAVIYSNQYNHPKKLTLSRMMRDKRIIIPVMGMYFSKKTT